MLNGYHQRLVRHSLFKNWKKRLTGCLLINQPEIIKKWILILFRQPNSWKILEQILYKLKLWKFNFYIWLSQSFVLLRNTYIHNFTEAFKASYPLLDNKTLLLRNVRNWRYFWWRTGLIIYEDHSMIAPEQNVQFEF
jgi:hypothetical protein